MTDELYAIATIVASFGVEGWCKLKLLTDTASRLKKLSAVFVGRAPESAMLMRVADVKTGGNVPLVKFEGIDDRDASDRMRGLVLFVEKKDLAKPKKGRYFLHELIGAEVVDQHGVRVGTIVDVYKFIAPDYWVVRTATHDVMIPAVKEFVKSVDIAAKKVVIEVIEGLLDA
jgi:16S rRNA processing protein RimM